MNILKTLVESFDDEQGLPEATYDATKELIAVMLGETAKIFFISCIDATEGRFYVKSGVTNIWKYVTTGKTEETTIWPE